MFSLRSEKNRVEQQKVLLELIRNCSYITEKINLTKIYFLSIELPSVEYVEGIEIIYRNGQTIFCLTPKLSNVYIKR